MTNEAIARLLLAIFGGNGYHAVAQERNGQISYYPVEEPLTEELLLSHLNGEVTLGSYQLLSETSKVLWLGWDVDSIDLEVAQQITQKIVQRLENLPFVVEFSGRKGYHILLFLDEPMEAGKAKEVVEYIRKEAGLAALGETHVETFPKQDKVTKNRPKGSLLKIPLGKHPKSHDYSRFVDPFNGFENGPEMNASEVLRFRATTAQVLGLIQEGPNNEEQLLAIIVDHWKEPNRHKMALFTSAYFATQGWGVEQTKEFIEKAMNMAGDDDFKDRMTAIEDTFQKMRENKPVLGRQGLSQFLSVNQMNELTSLVTRMSAPNTVQQMDDLRYNAERRRVDNVRMGANIVWTTINDNGSRLFRTTNDQSFYYDANSHRVIVENPKSLQWQAVLNKQFGLNPNDKWSAEVMKEIELQAVREASILPVYQMTFWDEDAGKLYVNLGGEKVYVLDGTDIDDEQYNGSCGFMFQTTDGRHYEPDFEADPIDAWEFLVNSVNFKKSSDAPALPEEQRELLKAWILATFFQEIFPTKPILTLIGEPGSGKTTAMRKIVKMLEGPDEDVTSPPTKNDALMVTIAHHHVLCWDNLEKYRNDSLVDDLNRMATGSQLEVRELYTTMMHRQIRPRLFVGLTAVQMPFSDETLFSRLLVLEMERLEHPEPEHVIQKRMLTYGPVIWADLLRKLNAIVKVLRHHRDIEPTHTNRLADFTNFCERIKPATGVIDPEILARGLSSIARAQLKQLSESSQILPLVVEYGEHHPSARDFVTYVELFRFVQIMAQSRRMPFKWSQMQFIQHIKALEPRLVEEYGAEIGKEVLPGTQREVRKIKFPKQDVIS